VATNRFYASARNEGLIPISNWLRIANGDSLPFTAWRWRRAAQAPNRQCVRRRVCVVVVRRWVVGFVWVQLLSGGGTGSSAT